MKMICFTEVGNKAPVYINRDMVLSVSDDRQGRAYIVLSGGPGVLVTSSSLLVIDRLTRRDPSEPQG